MRWLATGMVGALVSIGVALSPATPAGADGGQAQRYIVVLHDGAGDPGAVAAEHARSNGGQVSHVYRAALRGYAATMSPQAAARLAGDPRVRSVEPDQVVTVAAQTLPTGVDRIAQPEVREEPAHLTVDGIDDVRVDVDVAVLDTGISAHPDLNVAGHTDCSGGGPFKQSCVNGTGDDGNGHGTHVAGTIGALDDGDDVVGVAPGARVWGVKVLSDTGSGYLSWIVAGIDWVTDESKHPGVNIEVANMSLGCECSSSAMNTAITNSVKAGTTYAVAAGNSDKNASTFSPANHPDVITVSALADFNGLVGGGGAATCRPDADDTLADFSNWGSTVEIAAPGVCILSTVPGGGLATYSGTSMASPHVAGAAALVASRGVTTPATVESTLVSKGNTVWTDDSGDGITEPLLDVSDTTVFTPVTLATSTGDGDGGGGGGGGTTPQAPVASFTYSCGGSTTCLFDGTSSSDPDGDAISYVWTGIGSSQTGATASHTFPGAGSYAVVLTVTDDGGAFDSASATVTCAKKGKTVKCS